jgi:hypothetical protein
LRFGAPSMKGRHPKMPTRAVRHRHGAQVALLRCPPAFAGAGSIPRDGDISIPECVGGLKAMNSIMRMGRACGMRRP